MTKYLIAMTQKGLEQMIPVAWIENCFNDFARTSSNDFVFS